MSIAKTEIADGEVVHVQGSAAKPYELKNVGGIYSCSCPAWRNQSTTLEKRTCKHLRKVRGDDAETARIGTALPVRAKAAKDGAPVLLAESWKPEVELAGWWLSEKLDGVRAYWTGDKMLSRLGNEFLLPGWFAENLGADPLDGELWIDRGAFQRTVGVVRRGDRGEAWREVKYLIFDLPTHGGAFEERISALKEKFPEPPNHILVVEHAECSGSEAIAAELARVEALGGEGLMARKPKSTYVAGRSSTLLKIKSFIDDDAIVTGHTKGKGRHKGRVGALEAELRSGVSFNVGTGLTDAQRDNPPDIGSVIVVRYQELTRDKVPRFPSFVGVRHDMEWDGRQLSESKDSETAGAKKTPAVRAKKAPSKKTTSNNIKDVSGTSKLAAEAVATTDASSSTQLAYLEYSDGKSNKFWQVSLSGHTTIVRYGRIGATGTTKEKDHGSAQLAKVAAEKLIASKKKKGYQE